MNKITQIYRDGPTYGQPSYTSFNIKRIPRDYYKNMGDHLCALDVVTNMEGDQPNTVNQDLVKLIEHAPHLRDALADLVALSYSIDFNAYHRAVEHAQNILRQL